MKYLIAIIICISLFAMRSNADDQLKEGITTFHMRYVVVNDSLMGGDGLFDDMIYVVDNNPKRAKFFGEFWHKKAARYCKSAINTEIDMHLKKMLREKDKVKAAEIKETMNDGIEMCFYDHIYKNYSRINKMAHMIYLYERSKKNFLYKAPLYFASKY